MMPQSVAYATENSNKKQLTDIQAAEWLNISVSTLRRWRLIGGGPRWVRIGSSIRYPSNDIEMFLSNAPGGGGERR
jgi:predicted DNA-binding transcriptional regulator AlpA